MTLQAYNVAFSSMLRNPMNLFSNGDSYAYLHNPAGCRLFENEKPYEMILCMHKSVGGLSFEEFRVALQENKLDSSLLPWRVGTIINYSNHLGEDEFGYSRYETCDVLFCPVMKEEYGSIDYAVLCAFKKSAQKILVQL